jgi:hypothetical protein
MGEKVVWIAGGIGFDYLRKGESVKMKFRKREFRG